MRYEKRMKLRRERERNAIRYNPVPNQSRADRYHIAKHLKLIDEKNEHFSLMFKEDEHIAFWPYEHVITPRDEDLMPDRFQILNPIFSGDVTPDPLTGAIRAYFDPNIKATNVIEVITWYLGVDDYGDLSEMMIAKPIYSPLPCSKWGARPLTYAQWALVSKGLCYIRAKHQWQQAVRHYSGNDTFLLNDNGGWLMRPTKKVKTPEQLKKEGTFIYSGESDERTEPWIGNTIYSEIITQYSMRDVAI